MAIEIKDMIFIHTPKTGGSYITNILKKQCNGKEIAEWHDPYFIVKEKTNTNKKYFTFIRHPLSLVCSVWGHWKHANCRNTQNDAKRPLNWASENNWDHWHECINEDDLNDTINRCNNYHFNFLETFFDNYTKGAWKIGRQENLQQELSRILTEYNIVHKEKINKHSIYPLRVQSKNIDSFINKYEKLLIKFNYNYIPENIKLYK
jgi:hypothetical protein